MLPGLQHATPTARDPVAAPAQPAPLHPSHIAATAPLRSQHRPTLLLSWHVFAYLDDTAAHEELSRILFGYKVSQPGWARGLWLLCVQHGH